MNQKQYAYIAITIQRDPTLHRVQNYNGKRVILILSSKCGNAV
jgi:hypothetical protein